MLRRYFMRAHRCLLLVSLLLASLHGVSTRSALAVAPGEPAGTVSPVTAVRAGAAIDVEHGTRIAHPVVLVRDGRIAAIGPDVAIPAGATVVDLGNATLVPGLIDAHTHLLTRFDPRTGDAA